MDDGWASYRTSRIVPGPLGSSRAGASSCEGSSRRGPAAISPVTAIHGHIIQICKKGLIETHSLSLLVALTGLSLVVVVGRVRHSIMLFAGFFLTPDLTD